MSLKVCNILPVNSNLHHNRSMRPNHPSQNSSVRSPATAFSLAPVPGPANQLFAFPRRLLAIAYPFLPECNVPFRFALGAPVAILACSFFGPLTVSGQDLQTNAPPESPTPPSAVPFFGNPQSQPSSASGYQGELPAAPFAGTSQLSVAPPITQGLPLRSAGLVHWGFIHFYPFIVYDISYGNNLQSAPGQHADTLINAVTPGLIIRLGDHWTLNYTPTLRFYSSSQFNNAVDQIVNLTGLTTYQDWSFRFFQGYAETSQPLIETASQLNQTVYSTFLGASHTLGSHLSLDLGVNQSFRFVDEGQQLGFAATTQTLEWSTMDWVDYLFAPRLSAGIGAGFTYDDVTPGPDMTSEQFQGRVSWTATDKFAFVVSGGVDYRQFVSSPAPNLLSPLFSGSVQYHLFENTILSLTASTSVSPSYYADAISQSTSVIGGLHQRLLKHLSLDVNGGYTSTSYNQTSSAFNTAGVNNYDSTSFNVRLSTILFKSVYAALYYQQTFILSNSGGANAALFNYTTMQGGLTLSYHF
jgi:hypothetical protein